MEIGFLRHGETDWNREGRIQGHTDVPLNAAGIRQAEDAATKIGLFKWDRIYCSDLIRARSTADIICRALPGASLFVDPRLRERSYGLVEGTTTEERTRRFGADWKQRGAEIGLENEMVIIRRLSRWISEQREHRNGERLLIVSHGGLIRAMFHYWFQGIPEGLLYNLSLSTVRFTGSDWRCERYNDISWRVSE